MESISNTETWVPYMNPKDCSQGFCSTYCPQWCFIVYPPPPTPPLFKFPNNKSTSIFSPLVIAIIGILASAFLLVSYYAAISKYCKNRDVSSSRRQNRVLDTRFGENNRDPSLHLQLNGSANGLDEELIKSITMIKFKKEDGYVQEIDCSICLGEFHDDESLRLLPKCGHAFHASCIDVWLKSHSNCPLCRANIEFFNCEMIEVPPQEHINIVQALDSENVGHINHPTIDPRSQIDGNDSETTVLVKTQEVGRRSMSMDNLFEGRFSRASDDYHIIDLQKFQAETGTSRHPGLVVGDASSSTDMNKTLHHVTSPVRMKRSLSSGRLIYPKRGRGRNAIIPL